MPRSLVVVTLRQKDLRVSEWSTILHKRADFALLCFALLCFVCFFKHKDMAGFSRSPKCITKQDYTKSSPQFWECPSVACSLVGLLPIVTKKNFLSHLGIMKTIFLSGYRPNICGFHFILFFLKLMVLILMNQQLKLNHRLQNYYYYYVTE